MCFVIMVFSREHGDGSHGLVFPMLISWLQILIWLPYEFTWLQTQPIHVRDHHDGSLKGQEDGFMRFPYKDQCLAPEALLPTKSQKVVGSGLVPTALDFDKARDAALITRSG